MYSIIPSPFIHKSLYTSFPLFKKLCSYYHRPISNYLYKENYNSIDLLIEPIDSTIDELRYKRRLI